MSSALTRPSSRPAAPDLSIVPGREMPTHLDLPWSVEELESSSQTPAATLLSLTLAPQLRVLRPRGDYFIGTDTGIYALFTDPPLKGCRAPDWFLVLGRKPLKGDDLRSYLLWQAGNPRPLFVLELVSGNGSEERDRTPHEGRFWFYEQQVRAPYYAIVDFRRRIMEVYRLDAAGVYQRLKANRHRRYPIPELGVELGWWRGKWSNHTQLWARWYTPEGELLPTPIETAEAEKARAGQEAVRAGQEAARAGQEAARAEQEAARADREAARADRAEREAASAAEQRALAEQQAARAERLAARLRALGLDPE